MGPKINVTEVKAGPLGATMSEEKMLAWSTPRSAAITEATKTHKRAVDRVAEDFSRSATKNSSPGLVNAFIHVRKINWVSIGISLGYENWSAH